MVFNVNGDIVSNDDKWIYDWLEWESTAPKDLKGALAAMPEGDRMEVKINSGGGDLFAGLEIYTMLLERDDVDIEIQSLAGSAASIIAMAGPCRISPAAMLMVHDVSTVVRGNRHDLKKEADTLKKLDEAVANAYVTKTGMAPEDAMRLMDRETWITPAEALRLGLVDEILTPKVAAVNSVGIMRLTDDIRKKVTEEKRRITAGLLSDLDSFGRSK